MKTAIRMSAGILAISLSLHSFATERSFPKKSPVFTYVEPKGWKTEVDPKDGSITVASADERIVASFATIPTEATQEAFETMVPGMLKTLENPVVAEKTTKHDEDGLSGFSTSYTGAIKGTKVFSNYVLFSGGKDRSVVGNILVEDPEKLPKEDDEAMGAFMKSLKGPGQGDVYPLKDPVFTYAVPKNWKAEFDKKEGNLSINSPDGMVSVNFGTVEADASMEVFQAMLPAMTKSLEGAEVAEKAKEQTDSGLTGYTASYAAKLDNKPVIAIFMLIKGGKGRAVLGTVMVEDPEKLPKKEEEAMKALMDSMKAVDAK